MSDPLGHLSERHFRSIAAVIEGRVGIRLPLTKRTMVEGRLRKRVRALGLRDLNDYAAHLFERDHLQDELVHLIDCVTTNKTDFFREPSHFEFLRNVAVPALITAQRRKPAHLKVWSAACSTGPEVYTLAMVLQDMVAAGAAMRFSILGTDISTEALQEARAAIYPRAVVEPVPAGMRQRYVMCALDPARDVARIVPELRRTTQFARLNLMDESYPFDRDVDVIFCRNVLIYFDKSTQQAVISRLTSHLRPGGYLLLGHSESMAGSGVPGLRQVLPTIFRADPAGLGRSAA